MIKDERGITLVELLVVLVISALIGGVLVKVIYQIFDITGRGNSELVVQHDLQNAANWLNRDVLTASQAEVSGYQMVLTIPHSSITDTTTITYTYSEADGTLTRYSGGSSLIIARHVYSDPFPSLPDPIVADDTGVVTVTLLSREGDVPGRRGTFALKLRAGGSFALAEAPDCQIYGDESLRFDGNRVQWNITNDGSDAIISQIYIYWPGGNGVLQEVLLGLGEAPIWIGNEPPLTILPGDFLGVDELRRIDSGDEETLEFQFSEEVSGTGLYSIIVTFDYRCRVLHVPGWAVGGGGTIIYTSDGGDNWAGQSSPVDTKLNSVYFVDDSNGWAVGEKDDEVATILHYTNSTWSQQWITNTLNQDLHDVFFVDENTGWAVGGGSTIVSTTNNITWTLLTPTPSPTTTLHALSFVDANHGWAVGGKNGEVATILHYTNSTWSQQWTDNDLNQDLNDVFFIDENTGWAVGEGGTIIYTSDGGDNWDDDQPSPTDKDLNSVYFVDDNHGWAVGGKNSEVATILHYTNSTWSQQWTDNDLNQDLHDVFFVDKYAGWTVGGGGTILHTTDGGTSWIAQTTGVPDVNLQSVFFFAPASD